jgi:hypothetical protein
MRPIEDGRFKSLPLSASVPVTWIGDPGWNALRDLEYVLHEEQLVHNIATMVGAFADCGTGGSTSRHAGSVAR